MAITKAKYDANKRYDDKNYDRIAVLLPKGTKDQIKQTGMSINGFVSQAVKEKLEKDGN